MASEGSLNSPRRGYHSLLNLGERVGESFIAPDLCYMDSKQAEKLATVGLKPYSTPSAGTSGHAAKRHTNGRKEPHPDPEEMNGEELLVVDDDRESSSSGSSDSGSSSSGEESSSSSSAESTSQPSGVWKEDDIGPYIVVTCAGNEAKFYKHRFARGSIGKCVCFKGRWITPNEFQAISGRQSSKDWKRSIRLDGRCLKEHISDGLFREHLKTCSCSICQGEDEDLRRQEGVMALAAKRRRLSQAGADGSHGSGGPGHISSQAPDEMEHGTMGGALEMSEESEALVDAMTEQKLAGSGSGIKRKKRGRPPKNQRVWSPSGGKRNQFL